jgi:RNA polymerase sigma factor (sigma-70 family)
MEKTNPETGRTEDARLLTSFVNSRDEESFARLVGKYERLVWSVCWQLLQNQADAEDAFQNTFVLLATKAAKIRKPRSLASWLYGAAFRTATSIRRQRLRNSTPLTEALDKSTKNILEQVAQKHENEKVCEELMGLSEKFRGPMVQFYLLGESTGEIATAMGMTVSAIESRLKRGRLALKSKLLQRGIGTASGVASLLISQHASAGPALVEKATAYSMFASGGSGSSLPVSFETVSNLGAKVMITKCIVAVGVSCMIGVGIDLHQPSSELTASLGAASSGDVSKSRTISVQEPDESEPLGTLPSSFLARS